MAYKKGEKIEAGIWERADEPGYIVEVNHTDPETGLRVRERQTIRRKDDARKWRTARKADGIRGQIKAKREQPKPIPFDDFVKEYLKVWRKDRKPSTVSRERTRIKGALEPAFGKKPIQAFRRKTIEDYLTRRRDAGISPATANRELCRLKNMFRKAVEWGYLEQNPAEGIKQSPEKLREASFLEKEEVPRLISACDDRIRPLIVAAVNTGMRWGELMALEWQDIDNKRGHIIVRDPKNSEARHVPMNSAVISALEDHRKRQTRKSGRIQSVVFSNPRTGEPWVDIRVPLRKALKKAGLDTSFGFHGLRHTAASHMVMAGVDLRIVGRILGHKSAQITLRYAHLAADHLKGAVEKLDFTVGRGERKQGANSER